MELISIPFMRLALVTGIFMAVLCGALAIFVVLKRIIFVSVTLAQVSSAGVALALLLGWNPLLASLAAMLGGVAIFSSQPLEKRIPRETIIGAAYAASSALGIVLVAKSAQGEAHMLNLLFGNILAVTSQDVYLMAAVCIIALVTYKLFYKELLASSYDAEVAATLGIKVRLWEMLFYLMLGVTIAVSIKVAGVLLVFALLVAPGMVGLMLGDRLRSATWIAVVSAVVPVIGGLYLSYIFDLPPAATIVLLAVAIVLVAAPVRSLRTG